MMNNLQVLTSQILYDRIINVTLIRDEIVPKYGMYSNVDYNPNTNTGTEINGYQNDTRILMAGFSHYEFRVNEMNVIERVLVQAKGSTWKYDFGDENDLKAFQNGRSTTGINIKPGDRLVVNDNGKQLEYHVAESRNNDEGYTIRETLDITCPEMGIKPSISFSVNVIPGQHCYAMDLRITNMNLDIPLRQFNRVRVTAGYREGGGFTTFDCSVFSSYMETPNPDGTVVFRCITCGETNAFLRSNPIRVNYQGGISTIHDLIVGVCALLGVTPYDYLDGKYKYAALRMEIRETRADNALALLDWMRGIITQVIRCLEGGSADAPVPNDPQPVAELTSDGLYVYCVNRPNTDVTPEGKAAADSGYTIINLDAISGATFNGVALTVKSIWNPMIKPGRVFRMRPNIINGANLPNSMSEQTYGADEESGNLYRVLTQSINFSTNGKENEMTLLAVPIIYLESMTTNEAVNLTFNEWAQEQQNTPEQTYEQVLNIGQPDAETTKETSAQEAEKTQRTFTTKMFQVNPLTDGGVRSGKTLLVQEGDTLSGLAQTWYRLNPEKAPDGSNYLLKPVDCNKKNLADVAYIGPIHPANLWPVIAVTTYQKYKKEKGQANNKWASFGDLMNPDYIKPGEQVYVPTIEDMDQLAGMKNIFNFAYQAFEKIPGYQGWARMWKTIYKYLETY